jgi:hypothetical protein
MLFSAEGCLPWSQHGILSEGSPFGIRAQYTQCCFSYLKTLFAIVSTVASLFSFHRLFQNVAVDEALQSEDI